MHVTLFPWVSFPSFQFFSLLQLVLHRARKGYSSASSGSDGAQLWSQVPHLLPLPAAHGTPLGYPSTLRTCVMLSSKMSIFSAERGYSPPLSLPLRLYVFMSPYCILPPCFVFALASVIKESRFLLRSTMSLLVVRVVRAEAVKPV